MTSWFSATAYRFRPSKHSMGSLPEATNPISTTDSEDCELHTNCTGHIDRVGDTIVMPRSMCAYYRSVPSEGARMREDLIAGRASPSDYRKYTMSAMRGKRGTLRSGLSSFRVNSSIRAVIVPGPNLEPNTIGVPRNMLDQIQVVDISNPSNVRVRPAVGGDYMIVIRPPCLATGSAQPMKIVALESSGTDQMNAAAIIENGTRTALEFPLESCSPYNADFDGDEIHGNIVTSREAVAECEAYQGASMRSFSRRKSAECHRSKYNCADDSCLHHGMMGSTVTVQTNMDDVGYDVLATGLRPKHLSAFVEAFGNGTDANAYYEKCVEVSNAKTMKVSMQSTSGYIGRRARVAASMVQLVDGKSPVLREVCNCESSVETVTVPVRRTMTGYFGNPAIRGISKLTAGIMQEMLTVKVTTDVTMATGKSAPEDAQVSPVIDLLMGSINTMVMYKDETSPSGGYVRVLKGVTDQAMMSGASLRHFSIDDVIGSYSPVLLRYIANPKTRMTVATEGISMVLHCGRSTMDEMEFQAMVTMLLSASARGRNSLMYSTRGIDTGHLRWFPTSHSVYYSTAHPCYQHSVGDTYTPRTVAEGVLLCNYGWLRSVSLV